MILHVENTWRRMKHVNAQYSQKRDNASFGVPFAQRGEIKQAPIDCISKSIRNIGLMK